MKKILIHNFSVRRGSFTLKPLSLTIEKGEIFAILGRTGSGKTVLLEAIGGMFPGTGGSIQYDGVDVMDIPPRSRRLGFVYQDHGLFPHMKVCDNISYGLKMHGFSKEEQRKRTSDLMEMLSITHIKNQYPGTLSGGESQRTALARALALEPEVLLLDEPFSAMDTYLREGLRLELKRVMAGYGGVAVMVTHDRDEAYQLCDNLLLMDRGRVLAKGRTRELFQNPVTCQAARLTGCKNISRIQRVGERKVLALDWGGLELETELPVGDEITAVGIRAHDFEPLSEARAGELKGTPGANLIQVQNPDISEMPFEWYITLDNGLWWKKEKTIHTHETAGVVPDWLRVAPQALLLLSGQLL